MLISIVVIKLIINLIVRRAVELEICIQIHIRKFQHEDLALTVWRFS